VHQQLEDSVYQIAEAKFVAEAMIGVEPNNYGGMVCAFITSAEYQRRFSPVLTHSNSECQAVNVSVSAPQIKATVLAADDDGE
jgi:3,4-dihydroxy-2-butanone 4-phosphate synthase